MKVGDYVRTKKGIKQIYEIDNNKTKWKYLFKLKEQDGDGCVDLGYLCEEDIIKSSSNIIDLIEVGDILKYKDIKHYQEVLAIDNERLYLTDYIYMSGLQKYKKEIQEDLEWVVTREQIESMKYEVKNNE